MANNKKIHLNNLLKPNSPMISTISKTQGEIVYREITL